MPAPATGGPRRWGSVARRGSFVLREDTTVSGRASKKPRQAAPPVPPRNGDGAGRIVVHQEEWHDHGPVVAGGTRRRRPSSSRSADLVLPEEVARELAQSAGPARGAALAELLQTAARAYARDRYPEALRVTKTLVAEAPGSATARELHGLVCYRMGRYREALRHLEAARELSVGDPSQLPVAMDCHRALGHHRRVGELWDELRAASPDADVLAEGRLVMAADLADRGELAKAIGLLLAAGAARNLRHPAERHVRQWYLLADLAERAGDLPRARELFARVVEADPELADAPARLAALGRARPPRRGSGGPGPSRKAR